MQLWCFSSFLSGTVQKGGRTMIYDINIRHLEYFVKVSKHGSINKAAQALYISQPYLGKIMHDLEATLGVRLMNRSRSGITLVFPMASKIPRA